MEEKLQKLYDNVKNNEMQLKDFKDNYITGTINVKEDGQFLYFSVPYDEGWTIKVDDKVVEPVKVAEAMMAIPIDQGKHEIEMKYTSTGLKEGIIISSISILLVVVFDIILYLKKKGKKA